MRISEASAKGSRAYQEDRHFYITAAEGTLLGVADGHGGKQTAQYVFDHIAEIWDASYAKNKAPKSILREVVRRLAHATKNYREGSTLSLAFIPAADESVVYVAILGDSPVLVSQPDGSLWLSPEHNVRTNLKERAAAIKRGGVFDGNYVFANSFEHGLQMGRALGNRGMGKVLKRTPQVLSVPLGGWMLVASDGLFDPAHRGSKDNGLTPDFIAHCIDDGVSAAQLIQYAVMLPTEDNVTAVLWRRDRER